MTPFHISRRHHLGLVRVVHDDDYGLTIGWWLNGRIFGRYVSLFVPRLWPFSAPARSPEDSK